VDSIGEGHLPNAKGNPVCCPYLTYPQPGERFIVDTDARNVGIGGVLSHVQDREELVIAYNCKTLNKTQKLLRHPTRTICHSEDNETFP
jgi:hypothetical protein